MPEYYRAKQDVSIPRVVSRIHGEGEDAQFETEGVNYPAGSLIKVSEMTPHHRERAESGDFDHLLEPVSGEDAEAYGPGADEPEFGIFVAEHEAEAHALEQYGHHVIPKEQELEALSGSAEYARQYQQAAAEAGLSRRANQEAMHPDNRERVPDEVLYGAETRTGQPHNRGPEQSFEGQDGDEQEQVSEDNAQAARPRPPASGEEQVGVGDQGPAGEPVDPETAPVQPTAPAEAPAGGQE
jgi:hypothetical protein